MRDKKLTRFQTFLKPGKFFILTLYKIFFIPYKEGIDCPNLSPIVRIAAYIVVKNGVDLIYVKELLCHLTVELFTDILIVSVISHPDDFIKEWERKP